MVIPKIQALEDAKAKVAHLERQVAKGLHSALASLPDDYGFETVDAFVRAVKNAAGVRRGRKPGRFAKAKVIKKGKRAKITAGIRSKVKKLVKAGKTGAQIAKALKISVPSVQNIKKAAGLVRTGKKSGPKAKAAGQAKRQSTTKAQKKRATLKKISATIVPPSPTPEQAAAPPA